MTVVARTPVTLDLQTFLGGLVGHPVAIYDAPGDLQALPAPPYLLIERVPGGYVSGPFLAGPNADAGLAFRVRVVTDRADQAEQVADRARAALLATNQGAPLHAWPVASGYSVMRRSYLGSGGTDMQGSSVNVVDDYLIEVTPA